MMKIEMPPPTMPMHIVFLGRLLVCLEGLLGVPGVLVVMPRVSPWRFWRCAWRV